MFKYYIIPYILLFSALAWRVNINSIDRRPSGFGIFPDVAKVDENHELEYRTTKQKIEDFIKYTSYDGHLCNDHYRGDFTKLDNSKSKNIISVSDLAQEIYDLSNCFEIDPAIYASLIYKESQFCNFGGKVKDNIKPIKTYKNRSSDTGAGGLTMFTGIARKEIYDQLFESDRRYFHFKVRPKLHNMMAKCEYASSHSFNNADYYKYKATNIDPIYNTHNITSSELKKPKNWKRQLLYGAIKMKLLLSLKDQPDDFSLTQNSIAHYYKALRKYNGAGGSQEAKYWQYIFATYNSYFNSKFKTIAASENIYFKESYWINDKAKIDKNKK